LLTVTTRVTVVGMVADRIVDRDFTTALDVIAHRDFDDIRDAYPS
jgi:hypothetical protein